LLLLLAVVGVGVLQLPAAGAADEPTVEPAETTSGYAWKPSTVTAAPGGAVAFRNPGNVVPHGVHWTGGPEKPACSGVPVDEFGTSWGGSCTFTQAGAYTFVCTVHPEEMKGTVTVGSSATGPAPVPAPAPGPSQEPVSTEGPLIQGLRLAKNQRGGAVRGSFVVSPTMVGGSFSIELEARHTALGLRGKGPVPVGALIRSLARAGRHRFAVPLKPSALRALRSRGQLPTLVRISVAPADGTPVRRSRKVELHA